MAPNSDNRSAFFGKYPGIVVDNQPPEGASKFQGDIKVKVSFILDETASPIELWAKPCFHPGFFFIPEVGDNVWVEFVAGNIDFPVWSGVWYPQGKTPQTSDGQAPVTENKVIRTPSGHVLELDDKGEKVVLLDKNNNKVTLDASGIVITDTNQNQITLDTSGVKIADKSGNEAVMDATGVTVKSQAIKLGEAAVEPLVLGNQFLTLFNTHMHIGNLGAPTSPPAAAGTPALPTHLSLKNRTE